MRLLIDSNSDNSYDYTQLWLKMFGFDMNSWFLNQLLDIQKKKEETTSVLEIQMQYTANSASILC